MVYKDCNIGSAKPSKSILKKYKHHMIDILEPSELFTVADFCTISSNLVKKIHLKNKIPLFVGGSMMYFKSLMDGIHDLPKRNEAYRKILHEKKIKNGDDYLFNMLKDLDLKYSSTINKNDDVRILRALEIIHATDEKLSNILSEKPKNSFKDDFTIFHFGIENERDVLHQRIEKRLKQIIEAGLIDEVIYLLNKYHIPSDHPLRKAVNYKQAIHFLEKKYTLKEFEQECLFATRQLAKRQVTWLRSWDKNKIYDINDTNILENKFKKAISLL